MALWEEAGSWAREVETCPCCQEPCWSNSVWTPLSLVHGGSMPSRPWSRADLGFCCKTHCSCIGHPHRSNFNRPPLHPYFKVDSREMSTIHISKQNHLLWQLWLHHLEDWTQPAPRFSWEAEGHLPDMKASVTGKETCPQDLLEWCCLLLSSRPWQQITADRVSSWSILRHNSQLARSPVAKCLIWCPWQPDV